MTYKDKAFYDSTPPCVYTLSISLSVLYVDNTLLHDVYGVATVSTIDKITVIFCRIASVL